jgi:hypothetical protein
MDSDPEGNGFEQPMLTGLLLLPTGKKNVQFPRVGQFELSHHWLRYDDGTIQPLTETTKILDSRYFVSRHKHGDYTVSIV